MTMYPPSNWVETTVPEDSGGCGHPHRRPYVNGAPVHPYGLDCPPCEDYIRQHMGDQWSATVAEIPETYDEIKSRENFEKRGAKDRDNLMLILMAKSAGVELPESMRHMISGQPAHIPGQIECPSGHVQPSGMKFCGECGQPMHGSPAAAAIAPAVQKAPEPPSGDVDVPSSGRIKDTNKKSLQALCRAHGLDEDGTNGELLLRVSNAGLTINDLAKLARQPVAA